LLRSENSFGNKKRKERPRPEQQAKRTESCQNSSIAENNTTHDILHIKSCQWQRA
jgi:hypothetical protein